LDIVFKYTSENLKDDDDLVKLIIENREDLLKYASFRILYKYNIDNYYEVDK